MHPAIRITGLDISKSFVEIARKNAAHAGVNVDFRLGSASDLPFEPASFDFTVCQAAFKNFSQPVQAIAEMYRILRTGGTSLVIDLRKDASLTTIEQEIQGMRLGRIKQILTRWTFRNMLLKSAYTVDQIRAFVSHTPFKTCTIQESDNGFRLWLKRQE